MSYPLSKANIHSFLETDDRVADVLQFLDDAIKELDDMNGYITAYKTQLNVRISAIHVFDGADTFPSVL